MPYKSFGFTEEQVIMRDSVLGLLRRVLADDKIAELEANDAYPFEAYQALAEAGWLALPFDEAHGGAAASGKDMAVLIEALSYHHAGICSAYMTTTVYGGMHLQFHGSEAMRRDLLPPLIAGKLRMAIGYTEPSGGSDAAGIRTRAVRDGNHYVIDGSKCFITNAHVADYLVITAKTDPDAGRQGLSLFLVDTGLPGIEIRPMDPMGRRTSLPNEIFLDGVRVPADCLIGEENGGWPLLMRGLNLERMLLAAACAGQCIKAVEIATAWAREREAFGRKITAFQAVSHKLADMQMMTEQARLVTFHAAEMLDAGLDAVVETSMAKVIASEYGVKCADLGMQVMGGAGYMRGDMQRIFVDARVQPIGGGSNEIQRNIIADRMQR
jgi:alkylation response protein AidB-like acyl-CoA dehydrogenase